ncbi:MAG: 30S ribosomal protein S7 [Thermoproteota archaeon]
MPTTSKNLIFGKWDPSSVTVSDPSLKNVISLKPMVLPHTFGRHERERFKKIEVNLVERMANRLMRTKRYGGKKAGALKIMANVLELISLKTSENPLQVLVRAVENSAPREDTTRVSYGGIVYFHAVDMAPSRRVDIAIKNLTEGARAAKMHKAKTIDECLAEEIILAANNDPKSYAISKKAEQERHAMASR